MAGNIMNGKKRGMGKDKPVKKGSSVKPAKKSGKSY